MIKYKLSDFLEDHDLTQYWLCQKTGIRPGTINNYYHGRVKQIRPEHLDKICKVLQCTLNDIMEYVPDKK